MILVNALQAISARLVQPWAGPWFADVDLDLDDSLVVPSGPVTLTIGTTALLGTVDPAFSGRFGTTAKLRIVAGAAGWQKTVSAQHFANDAGLTSTDVYSVTAAEVGELLVDVAPSVIGPAYDRTAGPAARVLPVGGWYVTLAGVTMVGPRPVVPADPLSVAILSFDPLAQTAELASDEVIAPGTILTDPKFGTLTARDIEQTFTNVGARGTAWCSDSSVSRLTASLGKLIREAARTAYLKSYFYRVVQSNTDGRLVLQAADPTDGVPDALPITIWPGLPGASMKIAPVGALVVVEFVGGDPTKPIVRSFDATPPLELDIVATTKMVVTCPDVRIGGPAAAPLVPAAWAAGLAAALGTFAGACAGTPIAAAGSALGTALSALPPSATTAAKGV